MIRRTPTLLVLAALISFLILHVSFGSHLDCSGSGIDHSTYYYQDYVPQSTSSPLPLSDTPQFITLTSDDNGYSGLNGVNGGMDWFLKKLATKVHASDGSPVLASFYFTSKYIAQFLVDNPVLVKRTWREAMEAGHEVALHSHDHKSGKYYGQAQWLYQINTCAELLVKYWDPSENVNSPNSQSGIGVNAADIVGWRTPLLQYNGALFRALKEANIWYDSSIEDGWQDDHDGTNYAWPYTLDNGSPGHDLLVGWGSNLPIDVYPGLWELPKHPFIVPPDSVAAQYGIPRGLRAKCARKASWFDMNLGKITGSDYNLLVPFGMTRSEFLATLKYSFDLRYKNNRSPMSVGLHTDIYSDAYYPYGLQTTPEERRDAVSEFIDYMLSKSDVRIVRSRDVLRWMRDPVPKECLTGATPSTTPEPTPTFCPNGISEGWKDCSSRPECCGSGERCYEKNEWWASCREKCTPGETDSYDNLPWSCNLLSL